MDYDLLKLLDHPLMLDDLLPGALVVFGGLSVAEYKVEVRWRTSAAATEQTETLTIRWDPARLARRVPMLRRKVQNMLERDDYRPLQTENAAVVVTVAVLANIEPGTVFSRRSERGSYHDYFLNDSLEEMVEIAGRSTSKRGLDRLFLEEKAQSDKHAALRKRWVSVTVFSKAARNRTEGLHP